MNIALLSPSQKAYSQTFIQAHKNNFDANVFYYYDHLSCLEGEGRLSVSNGEKMMLILEKGLGIKRSHLWELAIRKSFKKHRIQKVYAEFGPTGVLVLPICKKMNIPLIVNFHGNDISSYEILDKYKDQYKELFHYAESIVVVSRLMKQLVIELGAPVEKIVYTPCAPDDSFFRIAPEFTEKSVVAVGRFVEKKAPHCTILAFKKVLETIPDAKLYMCGDGPLLPVCRHLIDYYKLNGSISLLGVTSPDKIRDIFAKAWGFVQHSITAADGDMEGTPVGVLEASAAALPVISTKHAGIPDVVQDGVTGLLVDECDVDGMAENMIKILSDREYAMRLGRQGRDFVAENFAMEKHMAVLNKLFI